MSDWTTSVVGLGAVVVALGVLIQKVIRPGARLISDAEELLPVFREIRDLVRDLPQLFKVTKEVAEQFKNDSGSSLRDVVDGLTAALAAMQAYADSLRAELDVDRRLAERDREAFQRSVLQLDRLTVKVDDGLAMIRQVERGANVDRVVRQGIAADLQASHERADSTEGAAGEASDAAARSGNDE